MPEASGKKKSILSVLHTVESIFKLEGYPKIYSSGWVRGMRQDCRIPGGGLRCLKRWKILFVNAL